MKIPCLVKVYGLVVSCIIGVHPTEQETPQELVIDLFVEIDAERCVRTDRIEDAVDYRQLSALTSATASKGKYHLIETLAWHILDGIMTTYPVAWAAVKIAKPAALGGNGIAVVEMERGKRL